MFSWWVDLASMFTGSRTNSAAIIWIVLTAVVVLVTIILIVIR